MEFSLPIIYAVCIGIVIGAIGTSLWQQRGQKAVTLESIQEAATYVEPLAKQLFDAAFVAVNFLEQISKPDEGYGDPKLTNEQKKAKAINIVKEDFPSAPLNKVDQAIEAAVYAVKRVNWNSDKI